MTKQQEKILAVLDMSEEEQMKWIAETFVPKYGYRINLADLAFRLRDEAINFNKRAWYDATKQLWRECHNYRVYRDFWVDRSKPIHWIVAALLAKESK